ncbi:MAG: ribonuclease P protein component [Bacteroidia bacterium]|jgi:ribonuclease P protein component|nr:ribonuclease P protein component [Bacteroidia bacterium]
MGRAINRYPVKLIHLSTDIKLKFPAQALFVVPKKNFKHAHDRNQLKRRMREIYRLNKNEMYLKLGDNKHLLAFVYFSKKKESYALIEKNMKAQLDEVAVGKNPNVC